MKISKKIAFFLEHAYFFEFYEQIIKKIDDNGYCIVLNDIDKSKTDFEHLTKKIENHKEYKRFIYLSDLKKENIKFSVLISTLDSKYYYVKFFNYPFFIRKKTFLSKILFDFFGIKKKLIENFFSKKVIFFPRGMDLKSDYPGDERINSIDFFLCHSELDRKIISKKVDKPSWIIGYPRYEKVNEETSENKILWIPSIAEKNRDNPYLNIERNFDEIEKLSNKYTIYLKTHPRRNLSVSLKKKIGESKINLINNFDLNFNSYYKDTKYIFCANTGPFFSGLYLRKKILMIDDIKENFNNQLSEIIEKYKDYFYVSDGRILDRFNDQKFWERQNKIYEDFRNSIFFDYPKNQSEHTVKVIEKISNL